MKIFWQDSFQLRTAGQWAYGVPQRRSLSRCRHSLQRSRGGLAGLPRGWVVFFVFCFFYLFEEKFCVVLVVVVVAVGCCCWCLYRDVFTYSTSEKKRMKMKMMDRCVNSFWLLCCFSIHPTTENRSKRSRLAAGGCAQQRGSRGISHGSI